MTVATLDQMKLSLRSLTENQVKVAKSLTAKDLFLSHSHRDLDYIRPALAVLESHGASVYVDVADSALEGADATAVASRIRRAVGTCGRLVALVTEQTSSSKWIPWEMGLADGTAQPTQVALMPARPTLGSSDLWAQQEYFGLYARIEYGTIGQSPGWVVSHPDGSCVTLTSWVAVTKR